MKVVDMLFFILITTVCYSQDRTPYGYQAEDNLRALTERRTNNSILQFNNRYQGIRGTPFLNPAWTQAEIISTKGDTLYTQIKLDIYSHDVWAILTTGDSIIVEKGLIKSFSFTEPGTNYVRKFLFIVDEKMAYFEVLYSGEKFLLLCKRVKELTPAVISGAYTSGNPYDEFINGKSEYFVSDNARRMKPLKQKISSVTDVLGHQAKSIVENDHLNLNTETDLIKLINKVEQMEK